MTTSIQSIQLKNGGQLFVEVEEIEDAQLPEILTKPKLAANQPPGTEEIGFSDKLTDVSDLLRKNLQGICDTVADSFKEIQPDEWGVEVNIGFKGKANPIPVILGGEANAAIKVHAKWKKAEQG